MPFITLVSSLIEVPDRLRGPAVLHLADLLSERVEQGGPGAPVLIIKGGSVRLVVGVFNLSRTCPLLADKHTSNKQRLQIG